MELTSLTIHEAADLLKQKLISPVDLVQAHLERIQLLDQAINAFLTVTPESALQQARQAENDILRGDYKGRLHGIPCIKGPV
jgi:aspartyl-tRNA(Asn)/glutamyl-tRNA(Gln) amidotransferase subunit A